MATWLDDEDLKARLLEVLQKTAFEETNSWDGISHDSNLAAYNDIVSALVGRGYTLAQIDTWDRRVEFETDIGLWRALVKGGCTKDFDATFIDKLDRRLELLTVTVTAGGDLIVVLGDGTIRSGTMKNDNDLFSLDSGYGCYRNQRR